MHADPCPETLSDEVISVNPYDWGDSNSLR